ncbi:MAG: right-handed parallel beta-helix repeat-containing protein, partial [Thermoguttaceae bacterium]|nr:right-handed parallel beta-helix repeat-containing protein [Thermoguttaceae bacterium]
FVTGDDYGVYANNVGNVAITQSVVVAEEVAVRSNVDDNLDLAASVTIENSTVVSGVKKTEDEESDETDDSETGDTTEEEENDYEDKLEVVEGAYALYGNASFTVVNTIALGETDNSSDEAEIKLDAKYSLFSAKVDGEGNRVYNAEKPLFADAENGDYSLADGSQAVDRGNSDLVAETLTKDIAGNDRIQGHRVDIGAYESDYDGPDWDEPSIIVTTLEDVVDDHDGLISLREAVEVYFHYSELEDGSIDVSARKFDKEADERGLTVTFDLAEADQENAVITLANGKTITIADVMTILNNNEYDVTVNAGEAAAAFTVKEGVGKDLFGATVVFDGVNVATQKNGIVSKSGASITYKNATIAGATASGAGIEADDSFLVTVDNATITGNAFGVLSDSEVAVGNGSVITKNGVGVYARGVLVDASTISENTEVGIRANVDSEDRGGIAIITNGSSVYKNGLGVHADGDVTITNSFVDENVRGGVLAGGDVTVEQTVAEEEEE